MFLGRLDGIDSEEFDDEQDTEMKITAAEHTWVSFQLYVIWARGKLTMVFWRWRRRD